MFVLSLKGKVNFPVLLGGPGYEPVMFSSDELYQRTLTEKGRLSTVGLLIRLACFVKK
jgi:hypothetical protein